MLVRMYECYEIVFSSFVQLDVWSLCCTKVQNVGDFEMGIKLSTDSVTKIIARSGSGSSLQCAPSACQGVVAELLDSWGCL